MKRANLNVLIIAKGYGALNKAEEIENYYGIERISGKELHDIGIKNSEKKYNSSAGKYQEIEGPGVAEEILRNFNISNDKVYRIKFLIGNHHSYKKIDKIDFQILFEIDFLVNIDEDKIEIENIKVIKDKYFKTNTGTKLLESMYLNKNI